MDYVGKANRYIKAVLTGKILACLRSACYRFKKNYGVPGYEVHRYRH